jgi:hypothetical protein
MSRRDLVHVLTALAELAGNQPGVPVAVADIDERMGRGRADFRTTLNLASLAEEGLAEEVEAGTWAATPAGIARHGEDEDYASR